MITSSTNAAPPCPYCGLSHTTMCHMIKAIEYYADGVTRKRVEFKTAADYPPSTLSGLPFNPGQNYGPVGMGSVATTPTKQFQDSADSTPQVQG